MLVPTAKNTAIIFLDLQEEIVKNSRTLTLERLTRTTNALAKLAVLHKLPVFLSAVPPGGPFLKSVTGQIEREQPRNRTATSAFADETLKEALAALNRNIVVLSGVASEVVVQRTALDALASGYVVHVAVDACGGIDPRTEDAAWRRIAAAGGVTSSVVTLAAELAGDFTTPIGEATLGIMYEALSS
jgi:nicotinamidase-related amidase